MYDQNVNDIAAEKYVLENDESDESGDQTVRKEPSPYDGNPLSKMGSKRSNVVKEDVVTSSETSNDFSEKKLSKEGSVSSRTWALKNSSNVDDDATHPSVTRASARTKGKKLCCFKCVCCSSRRRIFSH